MKHLLIILSILLLSSPVIGQSSKYESVGQCVLQTMKDNKLTGNDMFKMVKAAAAIGGSFARRAPATWTSLFCFSCPGVLGRLLHRPNGDAK